MFIARLSQYLLESLFNSYGDNFDIERFRSSRPLRKRILSRLEHIAKKPFHLLGIFTRNDVFDRRNRVSFESWIPYFSELEWLYSALEDEESKSLLVAIIAYRILGHRHVKLPLSNPEYWKRIQEIGNLAKDGRRLPTGQGAGGFELVLQDLVTLGYPLKMFMPAGGPMHTFILEQYACRRMGVFVKPGDVVIDAGACWGDTALYFAHLAGPTGRVYSLEFVQANIDIFDLNLSLNLDLKSRIELVKQPLWNSSGLRMQNEGAGPGACATLQSSPAGDDSAYSISIDDLVQQKAIPRVHFIKMDIEGAEMEALKGAVNTLTQHKPDLALCVYHSKQDFTRLARFVDGLGVGYRFALGHFTIHKEETVLYATTR